MRAKLERWQALPGDERRLLVGLVVVLPAIDFALRLLGVRRTHRLLAAIGGRAATPADAGDDVVAVAQRLNRLVSIASRHGPYAATCLRRALVLWWLLRRRGVPAALRVGVGKDGGRVRAHAWVELAGRAIDDDSTLAGSYAVYPELDRRLRRPLFPS